MPGCGSGVLVSSSSLLIRSHHGRCQAKIPLSPLFKFAEPPLSVEGVCAFEPCGVDGCSHICLSLGGPHGAIAVGDFSLDHTGSLRSDPLFVASTSPG